MSDSVAITSPTELNASTIRCIDVTPRRCLLRRQRIRAPARSATRTLASRIRSDLQSRVPPLPVQRRIAGILSAYDELIENSQRRIKILEAMARALYREWFVHFRFPGHENHPRVASPLGEIPQGVGGEEAWRDCCIDIEPTASQSADSLRRRRSAIPMAIDRSDVHASSTRASNRAQVVRATIRRTATRSTPAMRCRLPSDEPARCQVAIFAV